MTDKTPFQQYLENEQRIHALAFSLTKGFPPQFNIAPIIEVVRAADALGLEVSWKPRDNSAAAQPESRPE